MSEMKLNIVESWQIDPDADEENLEAKQELFLSSSLSSHNVIQNETAHNV